MAHGLSHARSSGYLIAPAHPHAPANQPSYEEGAARLQRVKSSQHLATSVVPLQPPNKPPSPKACVATSS